MRIVIVDDQWMIREGLASLAGLADDIEVVATGGDGTAAIALTEQHRPDVVLMDIRMPETAHPSVLAVRHGLVD